MTLDAALANLRAAMAETGAIVTRDPLPRVMADDVQLAQLFQNLVGNAIKYHGPGVIPLIHVSAARRSGGRWLFSVRDNGLGIEPQYFDRIFGMFQRLHRREEFAGTGIGLLYLQKDRRVARRDYRGRLAAEAATSSAFEFRPR